MLWSNSIMLSMHIANSLDKIMNYYKLSELCSIEYGKDHKHLKDGNTPLFGTGGIMRYVDSSLYCGPSVLIPRKGTLSGIYFSEKPFWTIDTLFYTRVNESLILAKYLYYYLKSINLESIDEGTTVPSLTKATLNELLIPVPSLKEQHKVVNLLSLIDDKIALNMAINDNLQ